MARLLSALGVLLVLHVASSSKLVCHMTNWAQYRPSFAQFTPDNIDPFLCTHVIYTMATINSFNEISTVEWNDEQQYRRLNALKDVNPALKTLLSVGGSVNGVSPFIAMVAKPETRAAFIRSAIGFMRIFNFDGLNLAWEFPGHNGSPASDKEKFTLLVSEIAKAFDDDARENRKSRLLLSANVAALRPTIQRAYEVDKIARHLDFINIMTYDFHGSWEPVTGHNAPLYRSGLDVGTHIHHNVNASVGSWLELGAPAEKLLMGFATYGRTFRLRTSASGLGAPADGPAEAGPFTRTAGFWAYYEICRFNYTSKWIPEQLVPYATNGYSWVGFDDKRSISAKAMVMTASLGGAHVWTLDMDDFSASCSNEAYPLINHLRLSMGFPPKPTTTVAPTTTTTRDPVADFCRGRPDGLYENESNESTYFQCFQGNTYLHHCQPGLVYVDSCKCCNWA